MNRILNPPLSSSQPWSVLLRARSTPVPPGVADRGNCRVQRLRLADGVPLASTDATDEGGEVTNAHELPEDGEELLNYPWGIAVAKGLLYASDMRGRLCVFDAASLRLLSCLASTLTGLVSPHAMTVADDELFVADYDRHCVLALGLQPRCAAPDDAGNTRSYFTGDERCIGRQGAKAGEFEHPVGVAVCDGVLFVSEFTGRRLQALTLMGEPLCILAPPSATRLLGLCVTADRIYAGDFESDSVHWWWRSSRVVEPEASESDAPDDPYLEDGTRTISMY